MAVDFRAVQPAAEVLEGQTSIVQRGIRQELVKKTAHLRILVRPGADQGLGEKDGTLVAGVLHLPHIFLRGEKMPSGGGQVPVFYQRQRQIGVHGRAAPEGVKLSIQGKRLLQKCLGCGVVPLEKRGLSRVDVEN